MHALQCSSVLSQTHMHGGSHNILEGSRREQVRKLPVDIWLFPPEVQEQFCHTPDGRLQQLSLLLERLDQVGGRLETKIFHEGGVSLDCKANVITAKLLQYPFHAVRFFSLGIFKQSSALGYRWLLSRFTKWAFVLLEQGRQQPGMTDLAGKGS